MNFWLILLIAFGSFCSSALSFELKCEYNMIYSYTCNFHGNLQITSKSGREISAVQGQHFTGKSSNDVKFFDVYQKSINLFPRGVTKFFKNIEIVQIYGSNLQEVTKLDLREFNAKLKILWLDSNKIKVIDADLFEFNKNLELITLIDNQIVHIENGAFSGLKKLQVLHVNENPCTVDSDFGDNRPQVLKLIPKVEKQCKDRQIALARQRALSSKKTLNTSNLKTDSRILQVLRDNQKLTTDVETLKTKLSDSNLQLRAEMDKLKVEYRQSLSVKSKEIQSLMSSVLSEVAEVKKEIFNQNNELLAVIRKNN